MARLRGNERYNNPNIGADLVIKKLNPGVDDGVGYVVTIYQDGDYRDKVKVTSRKKLKELIDSFKSYYKTDKAFLNGMLFHITYKNEKTMMPYGKNTDKPAEATHHEDVVDNSEKKEEKKMSEHNIDDVLCKKASLIERTLNRLFNPSLPIVKKADDSGAEFNEAGFDEVETQRVINESKQKIDAFMNQNKDILATSDRYKIFNVAEQWVSKLRENIRDAESKGAKPVDSDKIANELSNYFSEYDIFNMGTKSASSTVVITDDNIEDVLNTLDGIVQPDTDASVGNITEILNTISNATDTQIGAAEIISNDAVESINNDATSKIDVILAEKHAMDMLQKRFYMDTSESKYSGVLSDVVIAWAMDRGISMKNAEMVLKFCEADFTGYSTFTKMANIALSVQDYIGQIEANVSKIAENYNVNGKRTTRDVDYCYENIITIFSNILEMSVYDDLINGMSDEWITTIYANIPNVFLQMLSAMGRSVKSNFTDADFDDAINLVSSYIRKNFASFNGCQDDKQVIALFISRQRQAVASESQPTADNQQVTPDATAV